MKNKIYKKDSFKHQREKDMIDKMELKRVAMEALMRSPTALQLRTEFLQSAVINDNVMTIGNLEARNVGESNTQGKFYWNYHNALGESVQIVATAPQAQEILAETAVVKTFIDAFRP